MDSQQSTTSMWRLLVFTSQRWRAVGVSLGSFESKCFLTHWGRDKMDAVSQATLSNAFSWTEMLEFRLRFHWILFLRVQLPIIQHLFRQWLGAGQVTSHYLNQWWLVYWRIYASLGRNELIVDWISYQQWNVLLLYSFFITWSMF